MEHELDFFHSEIESRRTALLRRTEIFNWHQFEFSYLVRASRLEVFAFTNLKGKKLRVSDQKYGMQKQLTMPQNSSILGA